MIRVLTACLLVSAGLAACSGDDPPTTQAPQTVFVDGDEPDPTGNGTLAAQQAEDPLDMLPRGAEQLKKLCDRNVGDAVARAFCGDKAGTVKGLVDVQNLVGLGYQDRSPNGSNGGDDGNPAFALSGHSSALPARYVSAINPTSFVWSTTTSPERWVFLAFARGEQFVEMAAFDPDARNGDGDVNFYLLRFEQACTANKNCKPADLFTSAVEKNWTGWSLYQDVDLANTTLDCLRCHQPNAAQPRMLRMQELRDPWTHWFRANREGGRALLQDFHAAHGNNEDYGFVPAGLIDKSDPRLFEDFIQRNGFGDQPNEFPSQRIEFEVKLSRPTQPQQNIPIGESPSWDNLHAASVRGDAIPVPYHDVKVTDPQKLASMTQAYRAFVAGALGPAQFPDLRTVLLDGAAPDMGFVPAKGLDGRGILQQACRTCHNSDLNQDLSRARFDVTRLDAMSRAEKDMAIARIQSEPTSRMLMPPMRFTRLSDAEKQLVIRELSK